MTSSWIKKTTLAVVLTLLIAALGFGQVRARVTADAVASFFGSPTAGQVINNFTSENQPLYWGVGFEVVHRHLGIGGDYTVDFQRNSQGEWWLDWYGQAVTLNYHLFNHRTFIDPYAGVGLGSAGRVWLGSAPASGGSYDPSGYGLLLSIFPVASIGVGLDLDAFYVGAKISYLPVISPPPATPFENVPLGSVQVMLSVGVALGR